MKLILSSRDFRDERSRQVIYDHLPRPIEQCRVLFVPNEVPTRKGKLLKRLGECGFSRENIYLYDPARPEAFCDLDLDCLYISGGNTFAIIDKIRKGGLDRAIEQYVKSGVVYIGGSAGVHLVSQNFEHVQCFDANDVGITDFRGLGLFDGIVVCHFGDERKACYETLCAAGNFKVYALGDEDSLVFEA